jgi:glycosyltransferase involved in cell wall biosynthesis
MKVSVIIPVFNAEAYLKECILSIVTQTKKDIEIIFINDGSTDNSLLIIEHFAATDQRIVIINSSNKGVSAARNSGIAMSKGEFIVFADADDWMEKNMIEVLYSTAIAEGADLGICNVNVVHNSDVKQRLSLKNEELDLFGKSAEVIKEFMSFKYDYANWNKIYKRQVILQHHIQFNEKMIMWEDLLFNLNFIHYAKKAIIVNKALYNYRLHAESTMVRSQNNVIHEYNLLYTKYKDFAVQRSLSRELEVFKIAISRNCYYNIIPGIVEKLRSRNVSYFRFAELLSKEINRINKEMFFYSSKELKGFQGFKKYLLKKRQAYLFSLIVGVKSNRHF